MTNPMNDGHEEHAQLRQHPVELVEDRPDDGREELALAALAFRMPEELDERLSAVWCNPTDVRARTRLREYLDSSRLAQGTAAIKHLDQVRNDGS